MVYCNSKYCPKMKKCNKHCINIDTEGVYNLDNFYKKECKINNYPLYESIVCKCCNRPIQIWAKEMCKVCYYKQKDYLRKSYYIPKKKEKKIEVKKEKKERVDKEKVENIIILRNNGLTFQVIGERLGISKQRANQLYNKYNKNE